MDCVADVKLGASGGSCMVGQKVGVQTLARKKIPSNSKQLVYFPLADSILTNSGKRVASGGHHGNPSLSRH